MFQLQRKWVKAYYKHYTPIKAATEKTIASGKSSPHRRKYPLSEEVANSAPIEFASERHYPLVSGWCNVLIRFLFIFLVVAIFFMFNLFH